MTNAIEITDAHVAYRGGDVLTGVSLTIRSGDLVGIFGPNGAGKTTLLTTINGLVPLSGGTIEVFTVQPNTVGWRPIRKKIGYVPQRLEVDTKVPVLARDVVMMGRLGKIGLFKPPSSEDRHCVRTAMEQLDILDLADRPFGELSGGQMQKVLIARGLAQRPEILLLDEPFSSLDHRSKHLVADVLRQAHDDRRLTTLVVSHDRESLQDLCKRIVCLEHGKIVDKEPQNSDAVLC